jgi:hypothetical protein
MAKNSDEIVSNDKVRKPTAKKSFSLEDFKKKVGAEDVPDKPLTWIKIDDAIEGICGLPGFVKGYVCTCRGFSNTGKSTAICLGIVNAQKMGLLPIIIDCENNLGKDRLALMGFDWSGNYIYIDNEYLLEHFGKLKDKNKVSASIEDLADCVKFFLDEQERGNLPFELLFALDSVGTLNCDKMIAAAEKRESDSNFWNAAAYEKELSNILNERLPNSRKINKEYTNTFIATQKIGLDPMNKVVTMKGGRTWEFSPRLIYHFGGILTSGVKKITAISKKREISYGVQVKVNIFKNQIEGPLGGISMEGNIISTPHGFVQPDKLDEYKKKNILYFRNLFGEDVNVDEIDNGYKIDGNDSKSMFMNIGSDFENE